MTDLTGTRWIKKHGNVRTVLEVEDASNPHRIKTRVIDDGGSASYETGQIREHDTFTLNFYYEPVPED